MQELALTFFSLKARVAAILSIVETCGRLKIPVRDHLAGILPGLTNSSIQRLPELTPTAWAASNL